MSFKQSKDDKLNYMIPLSFKLTNLSSQYAENFTLTENSIKNNGMSTSSIEENTIKNIKDLENALVNNTGIIILKFGAEWCNPCKKIEPLLSEFAINIQNSYNIRFITIDVDECFELYAYLKTKKMMNGVPAILRYNKSNFSYIPNSVVVGANIQEVSLFLSNCINDAQMYAQMY
jgi:thiol-disulfide isomerase/thioredoxin